MSKTSSEIIDLLGGPVAVARLCLCTKGAVSQWKTNGIPGPREQFLRVVRPDVFGEDSTVNAEKQPNIESAHPAASECCAIKVQPIGDENGTFLCIAPPIAIGATEKRAAERREIKVQETVLHQRCGNERRGES